MKTGIKIAPLGEDVGRISDELLSFSSEYKAFSIREIFEVSFTLNSTESQSVEIDHNFGYSPPYVVLVSEGPYATFDTSYKVSSRDPGDNFWNFYNVSVDKNKVYINAAYDSFEVPQVPESRNYIFRIYLFNQDLDGES